MSILGKRTRSSAQSCSGITLQRKDIDVLLTFVDLTELPTRSKRRVQPSSERNKGSVDFNIHQDAQAILEGKSSPSSQPNGTDGFQGDSGRVALSPSKGNSSRKSGASSIGRQEQEQPKIPRTPRRRDALSRQNPETPRHRVRPTGTPLTPRTPRTPQNPIARPVTARSIYQDARAAFSSNSVNEDETRHIVGRKSEREELEAFVSEHLANERGGALYVSGPPGTGKSALINEVAHHIIVPDTTECAYLNCMSVKTARDVYATLLSELGISDDVFDAGAQDTLATALVSKGRNSTYLVVLDEIDALLDIDVDVLYNIFQWSLSPSSRLILIGIANALDLTDRFLPGLRARGLKPQLLPFLPYSAPDIASILTARLRALLPRQHPAEDSFTPFLMPAAIQLISKKVAAQTGDLRKAFDLARRAIDLVDSETKNKPHQERAATSHLSPSKSVLGENNNLSSPRSPETPTKSQKPATLSSTAYTVENAPRASISHVVRVASTAFSNGTKERLQSLNLQQKAVLCSLSALERQNGRVQDEASLDILSQPWTSLLPSPTATPSKKRVNTTTDLPVMQGTGNVSVAPRIREVYEAYGALCTRENVLPALSYSEFRDVISNLETVGLLTAADGKSGSFVQVTTPSRKGRGSRGITSTKMEDRRVHGSASVEELKQSLESAGAVRWVLERMMEGRDL